MRVNRSVLTAALTLCVVVACRPAEPAGPARVLVFSKTAGYRHESIEAGKQALLAMGAANGFLVDTTEDAARITEDSLKQYAAVIFLSPTGNVLERAQEVGEVVIRGVTPPAGDEFRHPMLVCESAVLQ